MFSFSSGRWFDPSGYKEIVQFARFVNVNLYGSAGVGSLQTTCFKIFTDEDVLYAKIQAWIKPQYRTDVTLLVRKQFYPVRVGNVQRGASLSNKWLWRWFGLNWIDAEGQDKGKGVSYKDEDAWVLLKFNKFKLTLDGWGLLGLVDFVEIFE